MNKENLLERLQREAREKYDDIDTDWFGERYESPIAKKVRELLDEIIANTLKQAAEELGEF